jgi:signal transduction histidine kinase/CheY-like chemotaxis protein
MRMPASAAGVLLPPMNPITLSFSPELEREFWAGYSRDSMIFVRVLLTLGIALYTAFCLWDWVLFRPYLDTLWTIRLGVVVPTLAAAIGATYFDSTRPHWQLTTGSAVYVGISGLAFMMPAVPVPLAETHFHPGVQMSLVFAFAALRLRFLYASAFSALSLLTYFLVADLWVGFSSDALISSAFFLVGTALVGMLTSYLLERYSRNNFLLQRENARLLDQVEREKNGAEAANASKTRFLAAASHDLRQPLHTIGLLIDCLRDRQTEPASREMADDIHGAVQSMENLFNGLLDISRLDAEMIEPSRFAFPVARLFETLSNRFLPQAETRGLRLRFRPSRAWIESDPVLLERILGNLIANALKYTETGGVLVAARARGGRIRIVVVDTGLGIAPEEQARVFEEFFQIDNPERDRAKGLGLGLSIVRRTADLLGHPLTLRSRVGRGTIFSLDVPAAIARHEHPASPEARETVDLRGLFVLVIDDEAGIRAAMQIALEGASARVETAASGADAIVALARHLRDPDVILSDYRLRDHETGLEAIDRVRRALGAEIPAAIVTGDLASADLARIRARGITLAHKPLSATRLRSLVRATVDAGADAQPVFDRSLSS